MSIVFDFSFVADISWFRDTFLVYAVEEVSMNWIDRQSVTELEVSLN